MTGVIEFFTEVVIQIATPHSKGTGFYLKSHNLIVTNEHVVRENRNVIIVGKNIPRQVLPVVFLDPKFDIAFIKPYEMLDIPEVSLAKKHNLKVGQRILALGHPFGFVYSATSGIISSLTFLRGDIQFTQHDAALNPGNSGGPLVNIEGVIVGINTFIYRSGENIGFALPINYLEKSLEEYKAGNKRFATRCENCLHITFKEEKGDKYCFHCGSEIQLPHLIEPYSPSGVGKTIEELIQFLGFEVAISRVGQDNWEVIRGSAKINISYHERTGLITADAYLALLPENEIDVLYTFLLEENYKLNGLTFSVQGQDIILSLLLYDRYLNRETLAEIFENLFEMADYYDNILVEEYGALWKKRNN